MASYLPVGGDAEHNNHMIVYGIVFACICVALTLMGWAGVPPLGDSQKRGSPRILRYPSSLWRRFRRQVVVYLDNEEVVEEDSGAKEAERIELEVKRNIEEAKKELVLYSLEERPWPVLDPWNIQETETKEDIINRLWAHLPEYKDLLLDRVQRIRLVELKYDGLKQFMLLYSTKCGANVFGGPPLYDAATISREGSTPKLRKKRRTNDTVADPMEEFAHLYMVHDGFGIVLNPEKDLWPLVTNPGSYVNAGSSWYLLPRHGICRVEVDTSPITMQTPCIVFGRVDKACEAVTIKDRVGFLERGQITIPTMEEEQTVGQFVDSTIMNMFGGYDYHQSMGFQSMVY